MEMLITDLTRMERGYICVAGVDVATGTRIRPVLPGGQRWHLDMARHRGGIFDFRRVIDLGNVNRVGQRPEIEDVQVSPERLHHVQSMGGSDFLAELPAYCVDSITSAVGPQLVRHANAHNLVTPDGQGECSLVIQKVLRPFVVSINGTQVRAAWSSGVDIAVTDLRLYQRDGYTPSLPKVTRLNVLLEEHFQSDLPVYAAFGLTRSWRGYHWLQVNSIHLAGRPRWRLPKPIAETEDEDD